ncbi:MAG: hypothetical protein HC905_02930 [Bacteroidales bacterium]|nr:hypothetical protein [Bacteroidales bacterium]
MKVNETLPFFENYAYTYLLAEERRKEFDKTMKDLKLKPNIKHDMVKVKNNLSDINLFCEEFTKFLEYVTINFEPSPVSVTLMKK